MTTSYKSITEWFLYNVLFIAYIEEYIIAYFSEFVKLFVRIQCRFCAVTSADCIPTQAMAGLH
jgi:hypothetical protein